MGCEVSTESNGPISTKVLPMQLKSQPQSVQ